MPTLNGKAWMDFRLLDIFTHIKGNQNNMASLEDGATPVVSAKNTNNGYKGFAKPLNGKRPFAGHCLTINNDGDGGAGISYYQPAEMLLDTHVTALLPRIAMSREAMLFIATCITAQREKFGHGYSLNNARLSVFRVMLPVTDDDKPDYTFMEMYIREREQLLIKKYIDHIRNTIVTIGGYNAPPK